MSVKQVNHRSNVVQILIKVQEQARANASARAFAPQLIKKNILIIKKIVITLHSTKDSDDRFLDLSIFSHNFCRPDYTSTSTSQ